MNMQEYEKLALESAVYPNEPGLEIRKGRPLVRVAIYPFMKLAGEAGEVLEKIGKIIRDKGSMISEEDKIAICAELGDVLWYVTACAYELEIPLETVAEGNILKLRMRKSRGTLHGSGDNR